MRVLRKYEPKNFEPPVANTTVKSLCRAAAKDFKICSILFSAIGVSVNIEFPFLVSRTGPSAGTYFERAALMPASDLAAMDRLEPYDNASGYLCAHDSPFRYSPCAGYVFSARLLSGRGELNPN